MKDFSHHHPPRLLTRRHAIRLATALSAGAALTAAPFRSAVTHEARRGSTATSDGYTRPEALVDVAWLQQHVDDSALVTVGFMPVEEFNIAHIPGLEVIDTSDASIAQWQQTTRQLLGDIGISVASTVVVYDPGTLFGARLWWILHYFGHDHVHVLDGGLPAWQAAGNEAEEGPAKALGDGEPYHGTPHADRLAQLAEVFAALEYASGSEDFGVAMARFPEMAASILTEPPVIIDARTPEEYAEGHIPGAVNINFPLNAAPEPPKFWKPASELEALYKEAGVTQDKLVIPYCASGVRSAVTAFSIHLIGYDDVALYTGSWLEWGEDPDTPKTEGDRP